MFERRPDGGDAARVPITIDGTPFDARDGDTVAAALLAAGVDAFRTTALSGAPRGPYCLMGTCFECLVEIDGVPNRQACTTEVAAGMRITLGRGARRVAEMTHRQPQHEPGIDRDEGPGVTKDPA